MKNIDQVIDQERERVREQTVQLQELISQDEDKLNSLQEDYSVAVYDGDSKAIDSINEQIKGLSSSIQQRKEAIRIMANNNNNPIIQRAVTDAIEQWAGKRAEIGKKAAQIYKELQPHHEKIVKGLTELQTLRDKDFMFAHAIKDKAQLLDSDTREALGITPSYGPGLTGDIARMYIQPLHNMKV